MTLTGKIIKIFPTKTFDSGFQLTEFVLEVAENPLYPQQIIFQLSGKNTDLLSRFKIGEGMAVSVLFNIQGRKWISPSLEEKYFNTLSAWKVMPVESATEALYKPAQPVPMKEEGFADDDLPF